MMIKKSNKKVKSLDFSKKTCLNCGAAKILGRVNFNICGQSLDKSLDFCEDMEILIECTRRPELGIFEPNITFLQCSEWISLENKRELSEKSCINNSK